MSLADQQWCPTIVQVTVLQARGLRAKGKSGTNDAYAVMAVGREKYQTSVAEKSVAPMWKEEATFDLPQPQHGVGGDAERSTLRVHVQHRALVGPDKLLGKAVIRLQQLSEDRARNKTEWFKLLDKTGKADKDRGEVLVDIQFMRNNMTASMFDLSAAGKSRSRLGKIKDKVHGKKKESDAVSAVVPSFAQVLTDSEEEGEGNAKVAAHKDEKKKKHKLKFFSTKSNLQKTISQSMSVLPGKNSSLSGSQSSGLNVDSSEGKKKFRFMIHKRSGSSESKDSSSEHQKDGAAEQSNLCINAGHVYSEEPQPRTSNVGSSFSRASSGHGAMEDVLKSSPSSVDTLRAVRQYSPWTEEEEETADGENIEEDEGELRREGEEKIRMEEMRKQEEEEKERVGRQEAERLAEEKRRQERRILEEEEKRQREEEEMVRMEEKRAQEERRLEEERRLLKERRRLEEEERRTEEEKVKKEKEERIRREEEMRIQEEVRRQEEERIKREEELRREEERRNTEEERVKNEEEERIQEEMRQEEENRKIEEEKVEKEKIIRREEEERIQEEKRRQEEENRKIEEEKVEKEKIIRREEEERIQEEIRRQEEENRRIEEEKVKKEKEERIRREEEERIQEEMRGQEEENRKIEEEKVNKEKEERIRRMEDRRREEEMRQIEDNVKKEKEERIQEDERRFEEERVKKEKEKEEMLRRQECEVKTKLYEQEKRERDKVEREEKEGEEKRKRIEAIEKIREVERVRAAEEKRRRILEEKEQMRIEEKEKMQREEEERIREEERKHKGGGRAREEEEEHETLVEEKKRREEQERRIEEEEPEIIVMEEQKKHEEEGEQKGRRNRKRLRVSGMKPQAECFAEITSTNPFDESFSKNPFEEDPKSPAGAHGSAAKEPTAQRRSPSAASSLGREALSTDDKEDPIGTQREKRPAPQPPGRGQAQTWSQSESESEQDRSAPRLAQSDSQSKGKDVKTASVSPQRAVHVIAPLGRSPTVAKNTQSLTQSSSAKGPITVAKQGKRPAPPRPLSVEGEPSSGPEAASSSDGKIPNDCGSEVKREPLVHGLNPFESDDDKNELTAEDYTGSTGSTQWPPVVSKAAADAVSQAKVKSSKKARAPTLPAKTAATLSPPVTQSAEGGHGGDNMGAAVTDNNATQPCDRGELQETRAQESPQAATVPSAGEQTGGRKEAPPKASRRLQPVKPLNPLRQQPVSVIQGERDNKSTGYFNQVWQQTKVNGTGLKGPYSQLTQEELISLVLKQEKQLSQKDKRISELEQYIDNLIVCVIEEKPSILMSVSSLK